MVDIQLFLNQSHPIRQSRREFRLNLDLIVSLSRSLSNTSNLLSKSVRRLRVRPINRLLRGQFDPPVLKACLNNLLDMLDKNRKFKLRPTHNTQNLSLESKIAFISAVLAPTTATQAVRNVVQERSSLHKLSQDMLCQIFTVVAATPLCSTSGTITSIIFTNNPGDLPKLQVINNLSNGATVAVGTSQVGFASGDGAMPPSAGRRGDCGYQSGAAICPSTNLGHDCSIRECPKGAAWFDGATAPDTAHAMAECSGRGSCNTATGLCICLAPFTGAACDLIRCPIGTSSVYGATCSGRGTCKSIQQLSSEATDPQGNPLGLTYGATPNTLATWDAAKIQGCDCETNDYFGPYENAFGDFTGGHDCSARMCPRGADPFEVGKVNEKQTLTCTADAGEFTLTFRGETTPVIPFNAGTAQVEATLQTLESVRTATITFNSGSVVCSATGVTTTVEFTFMQGDLSPLSYDASALTLASNPGALAVGELVKGTKANVECSARGVCDRGTGICSCYPYFLSSDGAGGLGRRGDCGYISPYPSVTLS
ncbi:hypothetical protein PI124_g11884 [Phytophthora idaei]|nr:hypothetical protein PI124_g11884 [Phytophthora idaei]